MNCVKFFGCLFAFTVIQSVTTSLSTVTYPGIGTFSRTDFYHPIYRPSTLLFLPSSPEEIEPTFELYTRANPQLVEQFRWNNSEDVLNSRYFSTSKPTKFITHSFMDNHLGFEARWMRKMKNSLLDYADVNVFIVDWSKGNFIPYERATVNSRVVGAMMAVQIEVLCQGWTKCGAEQFHIIGASLGAQVAGYAGKFLNGTLGQITGLDPVGFNFYGLAPEAHLWYTDAHFVDVIHTDTRFLIGLGNSEACGHVDFYVNGGSAQPGCHAERFSIFYLKGYIDGIKSMFICDHLRSIDYYIEAISRSHNGSEPPIAYSCESYDDFNQGKCSPKNETNSRTSISDGTEDLPSQCAILGPRAVEYADQYDLNVNHGRKFFINTADREPYFS